LVVIFVVVIFDELGGLIFGPPGIDGSGIDFEPDFSCEYICFSVLVK
jgi:hypothetical protein